MDAAVGIYREGFVGNHPGIEIGTDDMGERPGCETAMRVGHIRDTTHDEVGVLLQLTCGHRYLLTFSLRFVGLHKR